MGMHEVVRGCLPASKFSPLENLEILTRERIFTPIIGEFYSQFIRNRTNQTLVEILSQVPAKYHPPILHTLTTHVTKEKPIFVYGIGKTFADEDENKVRFVAASTDLLWCLSLIVDDIVDEDTQRANRETTWVIYGKEESHKAAQVTYEALQDLTEKTLSPQMRMLLTECVQDGIQSLNEPLIRRLGTSIGDILANIDRRARFHCEYPIKTLLPSRTTEIASLAIEGLLSVNRAGQILNDTKDLIPSEIYGRGVFSDLKSGTATTPLIALYQETTREEQQLLEHCFGNPSLVTKNINTLDKTITLRLPRERIHSLVLTNYEKFLDLMKTTISPDYFPFCQKWVDYKLKQANQLLLG